ncbi:hypothetical protein [Methylobacter tundripaludum]|uniref:hypothetical protein n=1 Tax=Methylobacter tundripaludum TaxID=173365 RepID=UPI0004878C88|nr:hypothetical protein [Methylobacter tundripaludum]
MPVQFSYTTQPSIVVGCDLESYQFFRAHTRTGALFNQSDMEIASVGLQEVIALDKKAQAIPAQFGPNHYIKLRNVFIDDKSGNFTLHVDYIHDERAEPMFTEEDIKLFLGDGSVRHFGQGQWVEVSIKTALFSSDYFSPVSDVYYD